MADREDKVADKGEKGTHIQDAALINGLLDIVHGTRELPNLSAINGAAMADLVQLNTALAEEQAARYEAQQKAAAEEAAAKAAADKKAKEEPRGDADYSKKEKENA
jgi:hypothetical protein